MECPPITPINPTTIGVFNPFKCKEPNIENQNYSLRGGFIYKNNIKFGEIINHSIKENRIKFKYLNNIYLKGVTGNLYYKTITNE